MKKVSIYKSKYKDVYTNLCESHYKLTCIDRDSKLAEKIFKLIQVLEKQQAKENR